MEFADHQELLASDCGVYLYRLEKDGQEFFGIMATGKPEDVEDSGFSFSCSFSVNTATAKTLTTAEKYFNQKVQEAREAEAKA